MPFRVRVGQHPAHRVNSPFTIVDMQHHWKAFVLFQNGVDFAVARHSKHRTQRGFIQHFLPQQRSVPFQEILGCRYKVASPKGKIRVQFCPSRERLALLLMVIAGCHIRRWLIDRRSRRHA